MPKVIYIIFLFFRNRVSHPMSNTILQLDFGEIDSNLVTVDMKPFRKSGKS